MKLREGAIAFIVLSILLFLLSQGCTTAYAANVTINGIYCGTLSDLSVDANGNTTIGISNYNCGGGSGDIQSPTTPSSLIASAASASQINLSWIGSTDNIAVVGYKIFRSGSQIATTTSTSYSSTGLSASTQYCYNVTAYDAVGNNSSQSNQSCATTSSNVIYGTKLTPSPDRYYGSVSSYTYPQNYWFVLNANVNRVVVKISTRDWTGNADVIVSNIQQPICTDFYPQNGFWYNLTDDSNETVYILQSFTAGEIFYATVCATYESAYMIFYDAY